MRLLSGALLALGLTLSLQTAFAFDPVPNVDFWDAERLGKFGVTVSAWKMGTNKDEGLGWVKVTYDCSKLPKDEKVIMIAQIIAEGRTVTAIRSERGSQTDDTVSLIFSVQEKYREKSYMQMYSIRDASLKDQWLGVTLSLKRIVELAGQNVHENVLNK